MVWMDLQGLGAICPPKVGLGNIWCNAQNIIGGRLNSVAHDMVTLGVVRDKRHGLTRCGMPIRANFDFCSTRRIVGGEIFADYYHV